MGVASTQKADISKFAAKLRSRLLTGLPIRLRIMNEKFTARIAVAYGQHSQKYASVLDPNLRPMANEILRLAKFIGVELVMDLGTGTCC